MTKKEQFRKSRAWLKTHTFIITKSLKEKLEMVPQEMRLGLCYIQNMVIILTDEYDEEFRHILSRCWKDKLGTDYTRFIQQLKEWGELDVDEDRRWSRDKSGYPMSYAVPPEARDSGTTIIDFEKKRVRLSRPKNKATGLVAEFALGCLKKLIVAETLVYPTPQDPTKNTDVRKARIKNHCEHIAGGDFSLSYGRNAKRLYHRVVLMPKEGRCNLRLNFGELAEYDVRTCHPFLMLKFFTDPNERTRYAEMVSGDIYTRIGQEMGIDSRKLVKEDFQRTFNISYKDPNWMAKQYVFQFYHEHFAVFAKEVLLQRKDLALCLQNFEAELMVQKLGTFCRDNNLFWVPMHDGFLARIDQGEVISVQASRLIEEAVGFVPHIEGTLIHP
jgi:hypothetical protein